MQISILWTVIAAARLAAQPPPVSSAPVLPVPTRIVVAGLIESLSDADPEVHRNAAVALANVGQEAVEALTTTLRGSSRDARAEAAYALGQIGGGAASATEPLLEALRDRDRDVRRQAALALGRIVAGTRGQPAENRPLAPPVPINAPPPVFPPEKAGP